MSGETGAAESGWTIDTLREHLEQEIRDFRTMLNERYETQTKALDTAFAAQVKAMETALSSAERLVAQARDSTEKAIDKAEVAAEKRFEAVNEFRGQLADQAANLMPRTEAGVRFDAIEEKLVAATARLDKVGGWTDGTAAARNNQRLDTGQLIAVVSVIIAAVAIGLALTR